MTRSVYCRHISTVSSVLKESTTTISSHQRRLSKQSAMFRSSLKQTTMAETVGVTRPLFAASIVSIKYEQSPQQSSYGFNYPAADAIKHPCHNGGLAVERSRGRIRSSGNADRGRG